MQNLEEYVEDLFPTDDEVLVDKSSPVATSPHHHNSHNEINHRDVNHHPLPTASGHHNVVTYDESRGREVVPNNSHPEPNGSRRVGKQLAFNCNVEQEMRDLWDVLSKSAYDKGLESSNILRAPRMGDTILFYQQRSVEAKPLIWRSEVIRYPPRAATNLNTAIISGVAIIDSKMTGMGGEATIIDGGIGCTFVEIKLSSNWSKGYSFTIIVIGRYVDTDGGDDNTPHKTSYDELTE